MVDPRSRVLRVAIVLHCEYITDVEHRPEAAARRVIARLFALMVSDARIAAIIRGRSLARTAPLPRIVMSENPVRVMATLRECRSGEVEGFACGWGDREAVYGRGTLRMLSSGFDLDLDQQHPLLTSLSITLLRHDATQHNTSDR